MIDLHTHTTASDGQYPPQALVKKAKDAGLSVLAITDHDTTSGLLEASAAAQALGITVVPGIELNIVWPTGEFHLLGLGLTHISQSLTDIIGFLQKKREERNMQIVQKMNALGIPVSLDELAKTFPNRQIGRPHFAAYLVQNKIVKTYERAFMQYLAKGCSCYVERTGANLDEAVQAICDSGGACVIAHPLSLHVSWSQLDAVFGDIHERGVDGVEAYHPGAHANDCKRLENLARAHGMFVTAGSDFHGETIRADRKIGRTVDNRKIADSFYYDELLPHLTTAH